MNIIAMVSMIIDHFGIVFLPNIFTLRLIGRIAFPLYAYCLINGIKHTKNIKRYKNNILILAIITQPIYTILFKNHFLNVLFLYYAYIQIKTLINKNFLKRPLYNIFKLILLLILIISCEYNLYGIALLLIFDFVQNKYWKYLLPLISLAYPVQIFATLALPLMKFERKKINKKIYYLFYPAHLLILLFLKMGW